MKNLPFLPSMNKTIIDESRLCYKIRICEYLESMKEEEILDVLELIKEQLKCTSINQLLIKILIESDELLTNNALVNIANEISKLKQTKTKSKTSTIKMNQNTFPLLELPNDMITTTSLYLNQTDLLCFERCNRVLYRMVNSSSYLRQDFLHIRLRSCELC